MARPDRSKGKTTQRQSIRDKARQAAETRERSGGGLDTLKELPQDIEFFKPKTGKGTKGENNFSIIPYIVSIENHPFQTVGELWHECTYWVHKVGAGEDSKRFICLAKTAQSEEKHCPICEYRAMLIKKGEDPELADSLKPKQRQIYNVLDHDDEDKGIQLFEMSPHMFGFMLDDEDLAQSEKKFDGKFYGDVIDGLMICARFDQGSFQGHKFPEIARIDFEERDDLSDDWIDEAVDLDACLRILTANEMNAKFLEMDGQEEEPEAPPEKQERSSRRTAAKEPEKQERTSRRSSAPKDPEPEPEPEKKERTRRREPEPKKDENECPQGLVFGTDCDGDACYEADPDCPKWDDCKDRQEEMKASKKIGKSSITKYDDTGEDFPF